MVSLHFQYSPDTQLLAQTKRRHTINQTEVDGLGLPPLVSGHRINPHAEHFRSGRTVYVQALREGGQQAGEG